MTVAAAVGALAAILAMGVMAQDFRLTPQQALVAEAEEVAAERLPLSQILLAWWGGAAVELAFLVLELVARLE